jgi:hypothetical protein
MAFLGSSVAAIQGTVNCSGFVLHSAPVLSLADLLAPQLVTEILQDGVSLLAAGVTVNTTLRHRFQDLERLPSVSDWTTPTFSTDGG